MSNATANLVLRQSAMAAHLGSQDPLIDVTVGGWKQLIQFISKYEGAMKWHPKYHAPMLMQMMTCLNSIERKVSMTASRSEGRLATLLDFTKSSGCGFDKSMRGVENFSGIEPAERKLNDRIGSIFPVHELLPRSNRVFKTLDERLERRGLMRGNRTLTDAEKDCLLLRSTMTDDQIIRYTIEYMARSFAQAINPAARYELIKGDRQLGIKAVLDSLNFLPTESLAHA